MAVVQEAVEDRRGNDAVSGEDLGPLAEALVRGEHDRAALVAPGDDLEEERRLLCVQGQEADLVDDQQAGARVGEPALTAGASSRL